MKFLFYFANTPFAKPSVSTDDHTFQCNLKVYVLLIFTRIPSWIACHTTVPKPYEGKPLPVLFMGTTTLHTARHRVSAQKRMHVTNSSWHGNGGLLFLFHHQRFLYNISLLPSGALYLEGFLSTKQTAFITKQFISLFIIIQRHMRLLIRASDQQEIITKTTSIDTVPAPGKANRCLHLCNFKEFLNNLVASTTRTYNVCLTRGPEETLLGMVRQVSHVIKDSISSIFRLCHP